MQATGAHNGGWLAWHDRKALYNAQLCTVAIIKVNIKMLHLLGDIHETLFTQPSQPYTVDQKRCAI